MWWTEFEQLLNNTRSVMRRKCKTDVHPEEAEIQLPLRKLKDLELQHMHTVII